MMRCAGMVTLLLVACGGDDGGAVIPGGGVGGGAIDGAVTVHVVDLDSGAPVAGATVRVGPYNGTKFQGTAGGDGVYTARGDYRGAQEIDVAAAGYATAVWIGVEGASVTIPLARTPRSSVEPPSGRLEGTIAAWEAVPEPALDHVKFADIYSSQPHRLRLAESGISQPTGDPPPYCLRSRFGEPGPCAWRINAWTGHTRPFAVMIDLDTRGTIGEGDDVATIVDFAVGAGLDVEAGSQHSGVALDLLGAGAMTQLVLGYGTPPAGLTSREGSVGLDLGDGGVLRFAYLSGTRRTAGAPRLSAVPGATYELIAIAHAGGSFDTTAYSIARLAGVTAEAAVAVTDWMPPPADVRFNGTQVSFAPVEGASYYTIAVGAGIQQPAMIVTVLDGATLTTLPLEFSALPAGATIARVDAHDVGDGFDPRAFSFPATDRTLERRASATATRL